jgi:protein-disulfide isomerase
MCYIWYNYTLFIYIHIMETESQTQSTPMPTPVSVNYLIPASILIAGGMIAVALYFGGLAAGPQNAVAPTPAGQPAEQAPAGPQVALKTDLDDDDFIFGNPDADVFIIEYSDIDCPFCARVHPTLEKVVAESNGTVAWVYRHFPLEQLHPDAPRKALAAECVGQLAGNDAFWGYLNGLILQQSTDTYTEYGVSKTAFDTCMNDPETADAIAADINRAVETGGRGTPHSIVSTKEQGVVVSGAQPESVWMQVTKAMAEL